MICVFASDRLTQLMELTGISVRQLAENTGIAVSGIIKYQKGYTMPGIEPLIKLSEYFKVPIDYFIDKHDDSCVDIEHYPQKFMQIRTAAYEDYLKVRRPEMAWKPYQHGWEAPWPYNLADDVSGGPIDYILTEDQIKAIMIALDTLSEKEKVNILRYYRDGLNLEQCGEKMGVTRERVRQIIAKGVRKLRHPSRRKMIEMGFETWQEENSIARRKMELAAQQADLDKWEQNLMERKAELERLRGEIADIPAPAIGDHGVSWTLEELDLSVRSYNCLRRRGVSTLAGLCELVESGELLHVRNIGRRSVAEVLGKIKAILGIDYTYIYEKELG